MHQFRRNAAAAYPVLLVISRSPNGLLVTGMALERAVDAKLMTKLRLSMLRTIETDRQQSTGW